MKVCECGIPYRADRFPASLYDTDKLGTPEDRKLANHYLYRFQERIMSLGVLNNISAIYAENNLNQTNASLQNVLTELSSGSRINSGASDAAGLSLADGLGANATALTQSATNASSGVGLLQVADGALSQVTNLLNRAVTLATEASNGTLNTTQDAAANQEYQSILAEINNIGSTSSFNGVGVFGSTTSIFTGDASAIGSSIDTLSIKSLSSSSVGDVGGVITAASTANTYTSGAVTSTSTLAAGSTLTFQLAPTYGNIAGTVNSTAKTEVFTASSASNTFTLGANAFSSTSNAAITSPSTLTEIAANLNAQSAFTGTSTAGYTATVNSAGTQLTITATGTTPVTPTAATLTAATVGTQVAVGSDTVAQAATAINSANVSGISASVQTAGGYSSLIINDTGSALQTMTTAATGNNQTALTFTASGGAATNGISYTVGTGTNLSTTDLSNATDAQAALTAINSAITDVAAQRGYFGSQINTLNAEANVASTEYTNVVSAQNNIMATDYGKATSELSKYQILSQTGISALAQANTVQQEVLKLLQ